MINPRPWQRALLAVLAINAAQLPGSAPAQAAAAANWPQWGGTGPSNDRNNPTETAISPTTVQHLSPKWEFTGVGNFYSTPTLYGNSLYAADSGGGLYSLNATTGAVNWQHKISDYTGNSSSVAHGSPAVAGNLIIVGDRTSAEVLGINRTTGALVWSRRVDPSQYVQITASPLVYDGTVYVGSAAGDEAYALYYNNYTPSDRGSVTALDAANGAIKWQTYMVPESPQGFTGGAVWGAMAIDPKLGLVYASTGNNYSVPDSVAQCQAAATTPGQESACLPKTDQIDSIVAMKIGTGEVKWAKRMIVDDTYTLACTVSNPPNPCPQPAGKDYDFGSGVQEFEATVGGQPTDLVGSGQKSGAYYALDAATGKTMWSANAAPGAGTGGILWGSATDSSKVYVAEVDGNNRPYTVNGKTVKGGSWAGLDAATGAVDWQVATPGTVSGKVGVSPAARGAVSIADGVMFAATATGTMVALNAATGATLWSFTADAGVDSGPAIANGMVFWGDGNPSGTAGKTLYAFDLAGGADRSVEHIEAQGLKPNSTHVPTESEARKASAAKADLQRLLGPHRPTSAVLAPAPAE